jgi:hypothetical protein
VRPATKLAGLVPGPSGARWLAVRVTAPADAGRANEAALALLATVLGLPVGRLRVAGGRTARWKRVHVEAPHALVRERLGRTLGPSGRGDGG